MFRGLLDRVRVDLVRSYCVWSPNNTSHRSEGVTDQVSVRPCCGTLNRVNEDEMSPSFLAGLL